MITINISAAHYSEEADMLAWALRSVLKITEFEISAAGTSVQCTDAQARELTDILSHQFFRAAMTAKAEA